MILSLLGDVVVRRTVGEFVAIYFPNEQLFASLEIALKKSMLTAWINAEFKLSIAKSALSIAKSKLSTNESKLSINAFVQVFSNFANIHDVLESATSSSTVVGMQSVERIKSLDRVNVDGTLDQFLTFCFFSQVQEDCVAHAFRRRDGCVVAPTALAQVEDGERCSLLI
jgi:hypothetical protein